MSQANMANKYLIRILSRAKTKN